LLGRAGERQAVLAKLFDIHTIVTMLVTSRTRLVMIGLVLSCAVVSAQQPFWQVVDSPGTVNDTRRTAPSHLDAPVTFTPRFATRAEWDARAKDLRRQVQVALGLWPMPERGAVKPVIHGRIERDGYTVEKVYFASLPGHYVTGNLYRPKGVSGRRPGVLTPHGHWENGRLLERGADDVKKDVASGGELTTESARYPLQARCAMLARLGLVVFMFDMVGYADSQPIRHREGFTDASAELALQSFMGLQAWNALRALDFLSALPDVDPERLALTGESGGGTQTFILAALDPRPVVTVPAVMVSGNMQGGCICENASLLRLGTNNIELAALSAPKPMALIGADDWTRDIETRGYPELQKVYALFDATSNVLARHFSFPHNYNQVSREFMYSWFNARLKLGLPEPVRERPVVPVPPSDLSVFDSAHPVPADAVSADRLRDTMATASATQMKNLAAKPEEFRRVVGEALEVMVNDRFRGSFERIAGTGRSFDGDGFTVNQSVLTRSGEGSSVPTIAIVPAGWKAGPLVIWAHPDGKASAFESDGRTPVPAVRALLGRGAALVAADVFLTGEADGAPPRVKNDEKYAGYNYGYNRTVIANRVHDLLTVLAFAKTMGAREIHLVGLGRAGVWALLARALAGSEIRHAALDLGRFEFTSVTRTDDPRLLPGAVKYGGILGFAALCNDGRTALYGVPATPAASWVPRARGVTIMSGPATPELLTRWVLGS
jgi:dienelactone hydrolase